MGAAIGAIGEGAAGAAGAAAKAGIQIGRQGGNIAKGAANDLRLGLKGGKLGWGELETEIDVGSRGFAAKQQALRNQLTQLDDMEKMTGELGNNANPEAVANARSYIQEQMANLEKEEAAAAQTAGENTEMLANQAQKTSTSDPLHGMNRTEIDKTLNEAAFGTNKYGDKEMEMIVNRRQMSNLEARRNATQFPTRFGRRRTTKGEPGQLTARGTQPRTEAQRAAERHMLEKDTYIESENQAQAGTGTERPKGRASLIEEKIAGLADKLNAKINKTAASKAKIPRTPGELWNTYKKHRGDINDAANLLIGGGGTVGNAIVDADQPGNNPPVEEPPPGEGEPPTPEPPEEPSGGGGAIGMPPQGGTQDATWQVPKPIVIDTYTLNIQKVTNFSVKGKNAEDSTRWNLGLVEDGRLFKGTTTAKSAAYKTIWSYIPTQSFEYYFTPATTQDLFRLSRTYGSFKVLQCGIDISNVRIFTRLPRPTDYLITVDKPYFQFYEDLPNLLFGHGTTAPAQYDDDVTEVFNCEDIWPSLNKPTPGITNQENVLIPIELPTYSHSYDYPFPTNAGSTQTLNLHSHGVVEVGNSNTTISKRWEIGGPFRRINYPNDPYQLATGLSILQPSGLDTNPASNQGQLAGKISITCPQQQASRYITTLPTYRTSHYVPSPPMCLVNCPNLQGDVFNADIFNILTEMHFFCTHSMTIQVKASQLHDYASSNIRTANGLIVPTRRTFKPNMVDNIMVWGPTPPENPPYKIGWEAGMVRMN